MPLSGSSPAPNEPPSKVTAYAWITPLSCRRPQGSPSELNDFQDCTTLQKDGGYIARPPRAPGIPGIPLKLDHLTKHSSSPTRAPPQRAPRTPLTEPAPTKRAPGTVPERCTHPCTRTLMRNTLLGACTRRVYRNTVPGPCSGAPPGTLYRYTLTEHCSPGAICQYGFAGPLLKPLIRTGLTRTNSTQQVTEKASKPERGFGRAFGRLPGISPWETRPGTGGRPRSPRGALAHHPPSYECRWEASAATAVLPPGAGIRRGPSLR